MILILRRQMISLRRPREPTIYLKLEGDAANCDLGHAFLPEVGELSAVKNSQRSVAVIGFDLNRLKDVS